VTQKLKLLSDVDNGTSHYSALLIINLVAKLRSLVIDKSSVLLCALMKIFFRLNKYITLKLNILT